MEIDGYIGEGAILQPYLGVKFKDGIAEKPDCRFRLIDKSCILDNKIITPSEPGIYWNQDKDWLTGNDLKNGANATVNYTLTAKPDDSHKTGRWFANGLHFVNTMKIPDDIEAKYDLETAIKNAGFSDDKFKINTNENNGTEIKIDFWVYSNDPSQEMDTVNITFPVTFGYKSNTYTR
ncbi:MAG: hypothetical protein K2G36_00010 [Ruminococcus sp.]|nr:hypothetical protein [Ruminococcus sp.]